jgi:hypothetical protein
MADPVDVWQGWGGPGSVARAGFPYWAKRHHADGAVDLVHLVDVHVEVPDDDIPRLETKVLTTYTEADANAMVVAWLRGPMGPVGPAGQQGGPDA